MIKKLIKKYQAYKDKRFLARLERVLRSNIVKSDLLLNGNIYSRGNFWLMLPKAAMEDILKGTPLNLVQALIRQGYYD